MKWPQITYIVLIALNLFQNMASHNEPRKGKYNFWTAAIGAGIVVWILNEGGFWK